MKRNLRAFPIQRCSESQPQERILVSHDFKTMPHHFGQFLQTSGYSPGVFPVKQYAPIGSVIEELVLIWSATDADEWKNLTMRIPRFGAH
jgi:hypothetical protein